MESESDGVASAGSVEPTSRQVSEVPTEDREEGEEVDMDATNEDDAAMMAMMGMAGFGSTKVRHNKSATAETFSVMDARRANALKVTRKALPVSKNSALGVST